MNKVTARLPVFLPILMAAMLGIGSASSASAQFVQYTPPGDFVSPAERQDEALDRAMQDARWRFGRLLANPWISLRDISYQDNVTSSAEQEKVSDLTAGIGAGINTYLPLGGDFVWSTYLLPEYVWWRNLSNRSRLNGRYGTGLFANLGRIGVEAAASRADESRTFSREVEERVNQRRDEGVLSLTLDLGKGFSLFATGSEVRYESIEDEPALLALSTLDRDERVVRGGIGFDAGRGLRMGVGAEESETEFRSTGVDRSNTGSSLVVEIQYNGDRLRISGNVAKRSVKPEPGSSFVEFDDFTSAVSFGWRVAGPLQIELFGGTDLAYSLQSSVSYFEEERAGVSLRTSLGSQGEIRLFFEQGESRYVGVELSGAPRTDDRESFGGTLTFSRGQVDVSLGAVRSKYESTVSEFDREFTRISTAISLGTSRLSPWG